MEAGRLKRELREQLNVKPKMSFGGTGVLEVMVDGQTVFSIQKERRKPAVGEIAELVARHAAGAKA